MEHWLPCSLSAAQRAQRPLGLKRLPQSMNTNGIDLYLHFLQGDLWTFIGREEPRPLCVLNSLKCWKSCTEALQFCHKLSSLVWCSYGAPLEGWLSEYNGTQSRLRRNLIKMLLVWVHFCFSSTKFW